MFVSSKKKLKPFLNREKDSVSVLWARGNDCERKATSIMFLCCALGAARPTDISMRIHSYWWAGAHFSSRSPAISHSQPDKPFAAWLGMADGWPGVWVAVGLAMHQPGTGRGICATWRGRALCGYKGAFVLRSDLDS